MVDETRVAPPGPGGETALPGPIPSGTLLFGVYEVLDQLGSGGMGDVYRARHRQLGSLRAIKVVHAAFANRPEAAEFFFREARAMLEVHHDAVVRCHDLLTGDDGRVYLVMEMVEGRSLADWIREGPLSENAVRALGARIASGLAAAHSRGVVHRDLSPDNILLSEGRPDKAKLIDFGIAKLLESGDRTVVTGFKGKISFASPEQFGMFDGQVSARSDLYSLGLVLAAAATGSPLPMGATVAEAVQVRQQLVPIPPDLPAGLRSEIAPLLAPDPADRPASAEGLFEARPAPEEKPPVSAPRRGRLLAGAAVVAMGLALMLIPALRSGLFDLVGLAGESTPSGSELEVVAPPLAADASPIEEEVPPFEAAVPGDLFERIRAQLLAVEPVSDTPARIWTDPDPVPSGAAYTVSVEADCDCQALIFSINGSEDELVLLFPNNHDARGPLESEGTFVLPSPGANPSYTLDALGGASEDTLKLLLFEEKISFPSEAAFFTTAQRGESLVWTATPTDQERLEELERLLQGEIWSTAETRLRIVDSAAE